ncbi:hypothetical protein KL906_002260 [Ogataea polymorpha]|nr:hypothetical protein KL906_002260 [Ogataea polymorpha]
MQPSQEEMELETRKFKSTATPELQENLYVHEVYNDIAQHFSQTRYKPWPMVAQFLGSIRDYSLGVDVGCGNGKYLTVNPRLYIVGSDYSTGLLDQAVQLHQRELNDLVVADAARRGDPGNSTGGALQRPCPGILLGFGAGEVSPRVQRRDGAGHIGAVGDKRWNNSNEILSFI